MQGGSAVCRNRKQNAAVIVHMILTDVWILTNAKLCRFRNLASSLVADNAAIGSFSRFLYTGKF